MGAMRTGESMMYHSLFLTMPMMPMDDDDACRRCMTDVIYVTPFAFTIHSDMFFLFICLPFHSLFCKLSPAYRDAHLVHRDGDDGHSGSWCLFCFYLPFHSLF
jgi:hypothetical protein